MLSRLLKNNMAIQVSINIMDAFVEMRKFLMSNGYPILKVAKTNKFHDRFIVIDKKTIMQLVIIVLLSSFDNYILKNVFPKIRRTKT